MLDNRHSIDLPYWARPGFRSMAAKDDGGGDPEFVDADDDAEDDDEDDEGEDDADADKSPEELRAELKSVQKRLAQSQESLNKASGSNKVKRDRLKKLQAEVDSRTAKQTAATEGDKPDVEAIRASLEAEVNAKANLRTIKAEARGALRGLGVPADQVPSIVNMLALDDIDVDDDGNVEGIDDAIDELKSKFPQLFPRSRKKASVAGGADRDGKGEKPTGMSTSQLQARAARGL